MSDRKQMRWDENATAAVNARAVLPGLAQSYFEEGRKLLDARRTPRRMHRFRLKTKRFRYTLELFRDAYGASLEKRLELLRPIQSALGDINDCAATLDLFEERAHRHHKRMEAFLEKRSEKKLAEFEEYWRTTFDAAGQSQAWVTYLSRGKTARKR